MFFKSPFTLALIALTIGAACQADTNSPVQAALALIHETPESSRNALQHPFDSPSRTDWHYFPREREGLALKEMNDAQKQHLWDLVGTALSETGIEKVKGVLRLEEVLYARENSPGRDPGNFHIAIWGEPDENNRWGWRFEGHHLSINITLQGEKTISVTPSFIGANPATVEEGKWEGFRNLPTQEDVAREFVLSLPKEQREQAIVEGELTDVAGAGQAQIDPGSVEGLTADALNQEDAGLLEEVLNSYTKWYRPEIVENLGLTSEILMKDAGLTVRWMGGLGEENDLHTYRIVGNTFDIQYANHQSNANHVHTLFRTVGHDFGE